MPDNRTITSPREKEKLKASEIKIQAKIQRTKLRKLVFWRKVALVYNPVMAVLFVTVYWIIGLKHADII